MGQITMSIKESNQLSVLQQLKKGTISQVRAAHELGITTRQIRNKLQRFLQEGTRAIVHRLRGRPSNNQTDPSLKKEMLQLIKSNYSDFGPTLAAEQLRDCHGIAIHAETLRRFMIKSGLWHAKKQRPRHRKWRERKARLGDMVQFDGSPHNWLEDRGPRCTLLLFIDDATSRILWGIFCDGESYKNVMQVSKEYFTRYGLPLAIYTDKGGVFKVNINNEEDERITQFERALAEIRIEHIHARSPQAKGRVERCFETLQDRLIKGLRLADINTIQEANHYLQEIYIPKHNTLFAVNAKETGDSHRPVTINLDDVLCIKLKRFLHADFTVRYCNNLFQLENKQKVVLRPKDFINVRDHLNGTIEFELRGTKLNFTTIDRPSEKPKKICSKYKNKINRPASNHPWRKMGTFSSESIKNGGYFR